MPVDLVPSILPGQALPAQDRLARVDLALPALVPALAHVPALALRVRADLALRALALHRRERVLRALLGRLDHPGVVAVSSIPRRKKAR